MIYRTKPRYKITDVTINSDQKDTLENVET